MKLTELGRAGRSPALPLSVELPAGEVRLRRWLRVLPGKRYVAMADWQGRRVLVKLLVGRAAARQYRREAAGVGLLVAQGIRTPELLGQGFRSGEGGWLLFEFLDGAESLASRWHAVTGLPWLVAARKRVLAAALELVGAMHGRGLWQEDLHLDNILWHDGHHYLVDGGSVLAAQPGRPLPEPRAIANLAVFFAQLPAAVDPHVEELLTSYVQGGGSRGLPLPPLQRAILRMRRWRLRDFLRKTGRDCSLFAVVRGPRQLLAVRREEAAALRSLLADPDRFVAAGTIFKTGGSSTVVQVVVDDRRLVIKRYNIKGFTHWLKRFWRPSRAWHAWRAANRLDFLGIATPRPLAVRERRCCWLRRRAYLVLEHLDAPDIIARFRPFQEGTPPAAELAALDELFAALLRERISHGDLKGHNLLWHDGRWALLDLDAMRHHRFRLGFVRAYARDRQRFLDNWPADSRLHRLLDQRLPRLPRLFTSSQR